MDMATVYDETRERLSALVAAAADRADDKVPACPDWTVKDVIAHVTGLCGDWRTGNLAGYGGDEWTAVQVAERRGHDLTTILAEWAEHAAAIAPALADPGSVGAPDFLPMVTITDLVAHEHDVRGALGAPGARDSAAVAIGLRSHVGGLRQAFARLGLPAMALSAVGLRDWMIGQGAPAATLRGEPFELFRATGGRRTVEEVRRLDWSGDAEAFIPHLIPSPFAWPSTPLDE